jgi:type I restriction enzyme R subunit
MIDKYMVLNDTEKLLMVMRPYQVYAAEALISKALNTSKNAFVWHTTGSGKTLTSFKVAQLLATEAKIKKIFFVVDRKDLDSQTADEFNKFEPGSVDQTTSTNVLVKQIKDKNRRLIVTTLQKMARAITNPKYENILG